MLHHAQVGKGSYFVEIPTWERLFIFLRFQALRAWASAQGAWSGAALVFEQGSESIFNQLSHASQFLRSACRLHPAENANVQVFNPAACRIYKTW